jgi:hypothetical protein
MKYVHRTWIRTPLVLKALVITAALLSLSVVITSHRASANSADAFACSGTSLHQSQVGANSDTFSQECDGSENLQSGQVLWHFVLTQTNCDAYDPNNLPTLTANFSSAGEQTVSGSKCVGGVLHWNIITNGSDTLLAACTPAIGKLLNLSHVCGGGGGGGATVDISTEIHFGLTDNGTPIVVGEGDSCTLKAPASVHDSSLIVITPSDKTLPAGSTVTFEFRKTGDCSGPAFATSGPIDVGGAGNGFVIDPALAQANLPAGSYSYKAVFTSSDELNFPSAVSECEPFSVFNAPLTPGYWKNHLALTGTTGCTGLPSGTSCSANGPFTKTYLPQPLGNYSVDTIQKAAAVWAVMNCSNTGSNATQNQNAAGCLAGHLLAAELNVANGAPGCISTTIAGANAFLISINYTGPSGSYTALTSTQRAQAISLKNALDAYNNGLGCNNFCQ